MSDSRARIWFSLFVLAVFCVGLGSGVLLGRRMIGPPGRPFGEFAGPPGLAGRRAGPPPGVLLDRLNRELALTEDQRARVDVLKTSRERLDRLQEETHNRLEGEQGALRDQIRQLLTPEQQQKFDRWIGENPPRGNGRRGRPPGVNQ